MSSIFRTMMRCKVESCRYTWSVDPSKVREASCACGGELELYDVAAEADKLPYKPMEPEKDKA